MADVIEFPVKKKAVPYASPEARAAALLGALEFTEVQAVAEAEARSFRLLGTAIDRLIELSGVEIAEECVRAAARSRGLKLEK